MRVSLRRLGRVLAVTALAIGGSLVVLGGTAGAAEFTVASTADGGVGSGSLRDVIENDATTDGDVVILTAGATYVLSSGQCSDLDLAADITIQSSSTTQNATIQQDCDGEEVIDGDGSSLVVQNVDITGGNDEGDGGAIGQVVDLTVIRSRIYGNATGSDGGALHVEGDALIVSSTIDGNCAEDDGGAMDIDGDFATFINSTVTNNISDDQGAIDSDGIGLNFVYTDVVANIHEDNVDCGAPDELSVNDEPEELELVAAAQAADAAEVEPLDTNEPANVGYGAGGIDAFGTVIALPIDNDDPSNPFNCGPTDGAATHDSKGYNYSDDDTCGFTNVALGDRENQGDPGLGALADNGGPTPTLLPAGTSPLVNFIPLAACSGGDDLADQAVTDDQRGIARPQDIGCEVGSVELEALVVAFTG